MNKTEIISINYQTLQIADTQEDTGNYTNSLEGHCGGVNCLVKLNSTLIASGSNDFTIKIWDTVKETCIKTITNPHEHVLILVKINDNKILSVGRSEEILLLDL